MRLRPSSRRARGRFAGVTCPTRASGQLAVGCYVWDAERGDYEAAVLDVLTVRGDRIAEVTGFIAPRLFARFGLPDRITE